MVSSIVYNGDGATRIFPVDFKILGENFVRVYVDEVEVTDKRKYDIINNSIVFNEEETPQIGEGNVQIYVATSESELGELGAPVSDITIVASLANEIQAISRHIVSNIDEILQADDNAIIATQKALEASNSATSASGSATAATTQAGIATTKAGEALTSANNASTSEANALAYRNTTLAYRNTTLVYRNESEAFKNQAVESASGAYANALSASTSEANALAYKDTTYSLFQDVQNVQLEISTRRHEGEYMSMDSTDEDFGDVLLASPLKIENNVVATDLAVSFGTLDCGNIL